MVTAVPIEVAVQKLRGFIADQNAKIIKADDAELHLEVTDRHAADRRFVDRPATFLIDLKLSQQHADRSNSQGFAAGNYVETRIQAVIRPRRDRDRRRDAVVEKARRLLGSLKSYLMAQEESERAAKSEKQTAVAKV